MNPQKVPILSQKTGPVPAIKRVPSIEENINDREAGNRTVLAVKLEDVNAVLWSGLDGFSRTGRTFFRFYSFIPQNCRKFAFHYFQTGKTCR